MAKLSWLSNAAAQAMANALRDLIDTGAAATLRGYSGTIPTDADTALSGNTLLFQMTFSATSFGNATDAAPNALLTANAITSDSSADASGDCTFIRIYDDAGTPICQYQANAGVGSGFVFNMVEDTIVATQAVSCSSFTITMPEAGA